MSCILEGLVMVYQV